MAWQPSAWPLLNDQDPHTGYMMQVRSVSAARHRAGVTPPSPPPPLPSL